MRVPTGGNGETNTKENTMTHADNPTNLECVAELLEEAKRIAVDRPHRVDSPPWVPAEERQLGTSAIRDLCGQIADCLIAHYNRDKYEEPEDWSCSCQPNHERTD